MWDITGYVGLFLTAFVAATFLPLQSEALLAALLVSEKYNVTILLLVATIGNVLGSIINWWLGKAIESFRYRRWFPANDDKLNKAQRIYRRFGCWSLLASWVPVIGDPLTIVAGLMREPLWIFIVLVTAAKAGRYLVIAALALGWR
jgi:membrane protein YqaA with SNARE-associated domain